MRQDLLMINKENNMNFAKLDAFLDEMLLRGYPGCELGVSVGGEVVYRKNVGYADHARTRLLSGNDISWVFSCSKVITCLAAVRLLDEGKFALDDPVSKYIPEFAHLKVRDGKTGELRDATKVMTVEHLFTMSGGMNYDIGSAPIKEAGAIEGAGTLEVVRAMAKMPLSFEPGDHYAYSLCHDVLAAVCEVASGMKFSDYLKKYFFDPLGIKDMGFRPNEEQKSRFCDQFIYRNGTNRAEPVPRANNYILSPDYDSGGAGLFCTVDDYLNLITVVANGGVTKDGYTLLSPRAIEMMMTNHLHDTALNDFAITRLYGYGWGLCGRVHIDPVVSCSKAAVGEFGWDGAANGFAMIDPKKRVALYFGANVFNGIYGYNFIHPYLRNLVYEALEI